METLIKDLKYGFRSLLKRKGFAVIAIVTLALGIGANTAIFTLVNAVLLKSLPVSHPEELVLFSDTTGEGTSLQDTPPREWKRFSYASYQYFRNHNQSFQDVTAFRSGETRLSVRTAGTQTGDAAQRASGHLVAGNYFSVLGVTAMRGRVLSPEDDSPSATPAAVISHKYWQQQLNSDQGVVGKAFVINGINFTVVGVTPPEFFGERVRRSPDFWLPLSFQPQVELRKSYLEDGEAYWLMLMGRLNQGVRIEQAQANVNLAVRQFLTEQAGSQLNEDTARAIQNSSVKLTEGGQGISGLRVLYSRPLRMLMAIVLMVLLIACANVGSLLLSRAASRNAEISVRMALGASRFRIIRQLLTESLILAVTGGVLGVLLAQWGVTVLVTMVAKEAPLNTAPDFLILTFTAAVSIVAGLLFGLVPAIRASKTDLTSALKEKSRTGSGRLRFNLSSSLVAMQVALSMVLLTGAGLFARSLLKLQHEDVGFDRENVLLVGVDPRLAGYKPAELTNLYQQLLDRLGSLGGVSSVTMATYSPMSGSGRTSSIKVRGYTPQPGEDSDVGDILAGPNYTETLGVPLIQGREIGMRDTPSSQKVAVINQSFVERFFKGQNPIGQAVSIDDDTETWVEIVGVVGDLKFENTREKAEATVYRPILQVQNQSAYSVNIQIRTASNPSGLAPAVRQAINQIEPRLPIFSVTTLSEQVQETLKQDRLIAQLVSFFGALALMLASIGLYGVMSHGVARRTNEIGIRMALGAERGHIAWMVLRETLFLVITGLVIGIPTALLAARLISNQLFGLGAGDPLTVIAAAVGLTVVALLAGYLPARRATRVDPLVALRYE